MEEGIKRKYNLTADFSKHSSNKNLLRGAILPKVIVIQFGYPTSEIKLHITICSYNHIIPLYDFLLH